MYKFKAEEFMLHFPKGTVVNYEDMAAFCNYKNSQSGPRRDEIELEKYIHDHKLMRDVLEQIQRMRLGPIWNSRECELVSEGLSKLKIK